ncbi:PEP-CTERM sorting domain-containing protein [bacterium]|nr:PEP-CTERM sorting domain-containing protein [bacterium]
MNLKNRNKVKKGFLILALAVASATSNYAAQVDIGITLGEVRGSGGVLSGTAIRLGTFTGYSDSLGVAFFTGKDYNALIASFVGLSNLDNSIVTDLAGNYYGAFDTATTASGTRLFAWLYSTPTPQSSSNWAVVSGGNNTSGPSDSIYNPIWLAVAPAAVDVNIVEMGTIYSKIYASSGPAVSFSSNSLIDPEGANLLLIPEPTSSSLLALALTVPFLRRRKK